jgi:ankyrin repeat protein
MDIPNINIGDIYIETSDPEPNSDQDNNHTDDDVETNKDDNSYDDSEEDDNDSPYGDFTIADACRENNVDLLIEMLEHPAVNLDQINMYDDNGHLPLYHAVMNNNMNIVTILVNEGVDMNIPDEDGWTPIHYARKRGFLNIVNYLLEHGDIDHVRGIRDGWTPLHQACYDGDIDNVKTLSIIVDDINITFNGKTPLYYAIKYNHIEIANLLLSNNADIEIANNYNYTPLHVAVGNNNIDMIKMLLEHGADIHAKGNYNATPWSIATEEIKQIFEYYQHGGIKKPECN